MVKYKKNKKLNKRIQNGFNFNFNIPYFNVGRMIDHLKRFKISMFHTVPPYKKKENGGAVKTNLQTANVLPMF